MEWLKKQWTEIRGNAKWDLIKWSTGVLLVLIGGSAFALRSWFWSLSWAIRVLSIAVLVLIMVCVALAVLLREARTKLRAGEGVVLGASSLGGPVISSADPELPRQRDPEASGWINSESPEAKSAREEKEVEESIQYMTDDEREILGYLLAHNQKMFTNTPDCGHANTLVSKGIVVLALRSGQVFTPFETPFKIPDHVWKVLKRHQEEFPYEPSGRTETDPWRRGYME